MSDLGDHAFGQGCQNARHGLRHLVRDLERIGGRLLHHTERNRRLAVEADDAALIQGPKLSMAHIGKSNEIALCVLEDEIVELLRRLEVGLRQHGEFALDAFDAARRHVDILTLKRVLDVLRRQAVGGEPLRIEPDAHGIFALAEHGQFGDAGKRLKVVLDVAFGIVGDFQRRVPVTGEGDVEDWLGVGFDFLDHRLVDLVGQVPPHPRRAVAHIRGSVVRIALELEADGDLTLFLAAHRC